MNYDQNSDSGNRLIDFDYMKGRLEFVVRDLEGLDERIAAMKRVSAETMRLEFTV